MIIMDQVKDVYAFMEARGTPPETIKRMRKEKIDASVLKVMNDETLKQFLPLLGDRIAVRQYCSTEKTSHEHSSPNRNRLFNRLREKLELKRRGDSIDDEGHLPSRSTHRSSRSVLIPRKKCANKCERKIELGWLNYDDITQKYTQIRKRHGGGTRSLSVAKDTDEQQLLQISKNLFFKDGKSLTKGNLANFECSLCDFQHEALQENMTVGEMYEQTKIPLLRFYLKTKQRCKKESKESPHNAELDSDEDLPPGLLEKPLGNESKTESPQYVVLDSDQDLPAGLLENPLGNNESKTENPQYIVLDCDEDLRPGLLENPLGNESKTESPQCVVLECEQDLRPGLLENLLGNESKTESPQCIVLECEQDLRPGLLENPPGNESTTETPKLDCNEQPAAHSSVLHEHEQSPHHSQPTGNQQPDTPTISFWARGDVQGQDLNETIPSDPSDPDDHVLLVRRTYVIKDMINAFSDDAILNETLSVHMVLPNGDVEKGIGCGVYRDAIAHFWNVFYEQITVGDVFKVPVIRHDWKEQEWQAVGRIVVKGWKDLRYLPIKLAQPFLESVIFNSCDPNTYDAFLSFLPEPERQVVHSCLQDFPEDSEELTDVLAGYDCKKVPTPENLPELISQLGHKEIIQKPKYISDCMASVCTTLQDSLTRETLISMYDELKPTTKKVLDKICFPTQSLNQVNSYLKRYIRSLDEPMLGKFVRFCTGSDLMPMEDISVSYSEVDGFQRRPTSHTCSNILEVPKSYDSFVELKHEFNAVLDSGVWVMDII